MNRNIICTGNDLDQVCADIEARGGRVESLDAGVLGNAGYRVNYFSPHQAEIPVKRAALAAVKSAVAPRDPLNGPKIPCHWPACNPEHRKVNQSGSAETVGCGESFERVAELAPPSPSGKALTGEHCQQVNNHAALTKFDGELGATPSRRNDSRKAAVHEQSKNVIAPVVIGEHAVNLSIEDRLQRLHATLKENGKLRRGKPSTQPHHARTPYKD